MNSSWRAGWLGVTLGVVFSGAALSIGRLELLAADSRPGEEPNQVRSQVEEVARSDEEFQIREDSKLDMEWGEFQVAGERIHFRSLDRELKLTVLENLAAERISRELAKTRTVRRWAVSGVVTEYFGSNFLLITRAVIRASKTEPKRGTAPH